MELLQSLLDNSDTPIVVAFLLGLLTAVSPCPLATNISAIGYISKDLGHIKQTFILGVLYTAGRVLAYTILGVTLIVMLRYGVDTFELQAAVCKYGEMLLPPVLILVGVIMLIGHKLPLRRWGMGVSVDAERFAGRRDSLALGVVFALAFCPTAAMLYFGMLIPMAASEPDGYILPAVYAIATGLPVVVASWILAYSVANIASFYRKMQLFSKWFNRMVAVIFISIGIYYLINIYI